MLVVDERRITIRGSCKTIGIIKLIFLYVADRPTVFIPQDAASQDRSQNKATHFHLLSPLIDIHTVEHKSSRAGVRLRGLSNR